jgi:tRNA pseudouridine38-40 synthase
LRYFIEISYLGTNYHGWQSQPNAITIQEITENCLSKILNDPVKLVAAGRTDAGVHANQMYAHFDSHITINDKKSFEHKVNSFLPNDIVVKKSILVHDNAHARFDALFREYEYHISLTKNPFEIDKSYFFKKSLDIKKMNKCCDIMLQHTNFKSFSKSKTDVKTYDCKIYEAKWMLNKNSLIFKIKADRFLRNMVRAIVGTLIEIGLGKITEKEFKLIIEKKDRQLAGFSVPAHALFLKKIDYDWDKILLNG